MKLIPTSCLLLLAVPVLQSNAPSDRPDISAASSALTVLSGNNSHILKQGYYRIESAADWKTTWLEHLGLKGDTIYRTAMEVDFQRCIVIAVFDGKRDNSCGFRVEAVDEDKGVVRVRFSDVWYQTWGDPDQVAPYAFIVLPKSDKIVVLQQTTHTTEGTDYTREVARLSVPKK